MRVRLLMGPAGAGKTFRCLREIREALLAAPDGPPLVLLAPKQMTYQLERQLLAESSLTGYTRLNILSFERLAHFVFERLRRQSPEILDEQGRLMVLRAIVARTRNSLKLFRASARLTGFAQQLSMVLRELQRARLTPESLNKLAEKAHAASGLGSKLQDLATLLQAYLDWLTAHQIQDADSLLAAAAESLKSPGLENERTRKESQQELSFGIPNSAFRIENLWIDGFAQLSEQELELLVALVPYCDQATITFCLDRLPAEKVSWLSTWSVVRRTFEQCRDKLTALPNVEVVTELLLRQPTKNRFVESPVLQHLEKSWSDPLPYVAPLPSSATHEPDSIRLIVCSNPEAEAGLAAREILRHVRSGGRFREATVLVRRLTGYHDALQRVFLRYQIPFFMDRREPVAHHPLPELTRSALRTLAFGWLHEDWFAALKTGLMPVAEDEIDRLENEALARGWKGAIWHNVIIIESEPELTAWLSSLQKSLLPPFQTLAQTFAAAQNRPTGCELAAALRAFWNSLRVEERLQQWTDAEIVNPENIGVSMHSTLWEEMNTLLDNVEQAFADDPIPLREWLPILEAGLGSLTVGVIPPALDQVLIGAIDRSRNPETKLALVLGLNEGIFPAPPERTALLSETDHLELEKHNIILSAHIRHQLGRERFFGYLAFTRASQKLIVTSALQDAAGSPLNPSPFLSQLQRLFPALQFQTIPRQIDWRDSEHPSELMATLLRMRSARSAGGSQDDTDSAAAISHAALERMPALAGTLERLKGFPELSIAAGLAPELAARLYGSVLRTSVSRMEQFAACPFKFFVHSGLRAEDRKLFELDIKEQGTFQHDVLALFHEHLHQQNKRWRDLSPEEARASIARLAEGLAMTYRDGLLHASAQTRFLLRVMTQSLQDFIETLVGWMRRQYQFDPVAVELPFGEQQAGAAWEIDLAGGHRLALQGRIDRIDVYRDSHANQAHCVVVDYKSRQRQLEPVLLANGLQLQLLTYLNVVRRWPNPADQFGTLKMIPSGVFYVSLRGRYDHERNRTDALSDTSAARQLAYRHSGRFRTDVLGLLDARPDARQGDQFNYRLTNDGQVNRNCREALPAAEFEALLNSVEANLVQMGRRIFSGAAEVAPYRKGALIACHQCDYRGICRIDPWTHRYRILKLPQLKQGSSEPTV